MFYRGLHCPICKPYLAGIQDSLGKLEGLGVNTIAISTDTQDRAEQTTNDWDINALDLGYDLSIEKAREWGLYISAGIGEAEPEVFAEPGLFLVKTDGTTYFTSVQNMPFARPKVEEVLFGLGYVIENNYPARGEKV